MPAALVFGFAISQALYNAVIDFATQQSEIALNKLDFKGIDVPHKVHEEGEPDEIGWNYWRTARMAVVGVARPFARAAHGLLSLFSPTPSPLPPSFRSSPGLFPFLMPQRYCQVTPIHVEGHNQTKIHCTACHRPYENKQCLCNHF